MAVNTQNSAAEADFDILFEKFADTVYRLAFLRTKNGADADDIVQEVFLRYLKRRPVFNDSDHQKAWFLRVTANCTNSFFTSAWMRHKSNDKDAVLKSVVNDSEVYSEVLSLPLKYRTVIHLYYYEGYSVREIAYILRAKESTVKSRLFRAREMLRKELKGEFSDV